MALSPLSYICFSTKCRLWILGQIGKNSLSISVLTILMAMCNLDFPQCEKNYTGENTCVLVLVMDKSLEQQDSNECPGDVEVRIIEKENKEKPHKCNQCDYASSRATHLRTHLKTHSGEKPNKCNQCDYASSEARNLRRHMKIHCTEKWAKDKQMKPM